MAMTPELNAATDRLGSCIDSLGWVAVAVSGGVDSLTLAAFTHRRPGIACEMYHAVSPAVPADATERTIALAAREGWKLQLIDAGEFADPDYIRNPVNRCFYCKHNLYAAIARRSGAQIISGTNRDDLQDFRPGLGAAAEHAVRHPYVEAGIDKAMLRKLSSRLGLGGIAALPASPCLASRVETGIRVQAAALLAIHRVERAIAGRFEPAAVRCRLRHEAIVIELDDAAVGSVAEQDRAAIIALVREHFADVAAELPVRIERYRRGSAFIDALAPQRSVGASSQ